MLLEFKENNIFQTKEQSILSTIQAVFSSEEIPLQHNALG